MSFINENRKPSTEDIMKIFHEQAFHSTSDHGEDFQSTDPLGRIIALT